MVEASTLPDGLINTTTTFPSPFLFASLTWPVIFTVERVRDAAALNESSIDGKTSDPRVSDERGVGVGSAEGTGVGSGVATGVACGFGGGVSVLGVSEETGSGDGVAADPEATDEGVETVSVPEGGLIAVVSAGVLAAVVVLAVPLTIAGPIRSSSPSSEPLILR